MTLSAWRASLLAASSAVQAGVRQAVEQVQGRIEADINGAAKAVQQMDWVLRSWEQDLHTWQALLASPAATAADRARFAESARLHTEFAIPFYGDMREKEGMDTSAAKAQIERAPIGMAWVPVIVLGTLVAGIVATSWAVARFPDAMAAWQAQKNILADLKARDAASREGRTLPGSTLPPPPDESPDAAMILGGVFVVGLVAGGIGLVLAHKRG